MADQVGARCCIAGGGPAGLMLGLLLARAGVDVVVLERHADFLRDFRGDTIHPSTLEVMHELGLLDELLKLPHQELRELRAQIGSRTVAVADFRHLPTRCRFIALMPQWDFLSFLATHAARYPTFHLWMRAEVTGLIESASAITGVNVSTPDGTRAVTAELVIGADGRQSRVRECARLAVDDLGAPMDVLWFRLSRRAGDPETMGRFEQGRILVTIDRGDYWQCGYVIPKGGIEDVPRRGIESLRADLAALAPHTRERTGELRDWSDVMLLTVRVDRLRRWYRPGVLCIGDAAHAMSPIGGVGINLAIQDAVAAANILSSPLRDRRVTPGDLARVQRRRELPTRMTQRIQLAVQRRLIAPVLGGRIPARPSIALRLLGSIALLRRIPARLIGVGIRPEHVRSPLPRR